MVRQIPRVRQSVIELFRPTGVPVIGVYLMCLSVFKDSLHLVLSSGCLTLLKITRIWRMIIVNIWRRVVDIVLINIFPTDILPKSAFPWRIWTKYIKLLLAAANFNGQQFDLKRYNNFTCRYCLYISQWSEVSLCITRMFNVNVPVYLFDTERICILQTIAI